MFGDLCSLPGDRPKHPTVRLYAENKDKSRLKGFLGQKLRVFREKPYKGSRDDIVEAQSNRDLIIHRTE